MKLAVEIFRVTNKAISSSPFLLFQPLWTFTILIFFWVLWVAVLLSLGTAGKASGHGPPCPASGTETFIILELLVSFHGDQTSHGTRGI